MNGNIYFKSYGFSIIKPLNKLNLLIQLYLNLDQIYKLYYFDLCDKNQSDILCNKHEIPQIMCALIT